MYDYIIIGGGIGGLTISNYLAKRRKKVLLLEKQPKIGGYITEFKIGEFLYDTGIFLVGCKEFIEELELKIKTKKDEIIYQSIWPKHCLEINRNEKEYAKKLGLLYPKEKKGIEKLFSLYKKIYLDYQKIRGKEPWTIEYPIKYPHIAFNAKKTLKQTIKKYIKNKELQSIITQECFFCGLEPQRISAVYYAIAWNALHIEGPLYMQKATDIIKALKNNLGDQIKINEEAIKIITKKGKAIGVITNKQEYYAKNIISSMDATKTYDLINEKKARKIKKKIRKLDCDISNFKIFIGLKKDVKKCFKSKNIIINNSYDLDKDFREGLTNPNKATLIVGYTGNEKTGASPKEKAVISISQKTSYKYWKNIKNYQKEKKEWANILIKRAKKIIPFEIEEMNISTPITFEKYTGNKSGASMGWLQTTKQSGRKRLTSETPIKNLYLCSAWTQPGAGTGAIMCCASELNTKLRRKENERKISTNIKKLFRI